MEARPRLIADDAVTRALAGLPGWRRDGRVLRCSYRFPRFLSAVQFTQAVAHVAEQLDHHPEWTVRFRVVELSTTTHDAGGLTDRDLELAARLVRLAGEHGGAPAPERI